MHLTLHPLDAVSHHNPILHSVAADVLTGTSHRLWMGRATSARRLLYPRQTSIAFRVRNGVCPARGERRRYGHGNRQSGRLVGRRGGLGDWEGREIRECERGSSEESIASKGGAYSMTNMEVADGLKLYGKENKLAYHLLVLLLDELLSKRLRREPYGGMEFQKGAGITTAISVNKEQNNHNAK